MGAFFLFIGCLIYLYLKHTYDSTKRSLINDINKVEHNYDDGLQFQYEFETRKQEWVFEDLTGMNKEIIANILSARRDKVEYDPDLLCSGDMMQTAENAIIAYRLGLLGVKLNEDRLEYESEDVDLTIPEDYITQGKLYLLGVQDLEALTGIDYQRLIRKFALLNEEKMTYQPDECYKRIKGIMIRYYMESQGLQFYGMQDYLFLNIVRPYNIRRNEINDRFSLDDCKNWETPLEFIG